jgi:hypothetical protein
MSLEIGDKLFIGSSVLSIIGVGLRLYRKRQKYTEDVFKQLAANILWTQDVVTDVAQRLGLRVPERPPLAVKTPPPDPVRAMADIAEEFSGRKDSGTPFQSRRRRP